MAESVGVLRAKDVVSLEIDSLGLLATPSSLEPIAEHEELVSHLRICPSMDPLEADLTRCMFRIETEVGQRPEIRFGSVIKLIHVPSELSIVASPDEDVGYADAQGELAPSLRCIYLRRNFEGLGELAHKWIVQPRYRLRSDADPVRNNDYVILRNAQYKNLCLTSFPVDSETYPEKLVGLGATEAAISRPGIKLCRLLSSEDGKNATGGEAAEGAPTIDFVNGGDYVRFLHRENNSHLLCRVDDEEELLSTITPLGSVCRKRMDEKDRVHAVVARAVVMQQPRTIYDFPVANSSLGIWQIIPVERADQNRVFHRVPYGCAIRLRHVVSGQYLAIRPVHRSDSRKLKEHVYVHKDHNHHDSPVPDSKPEDSVAAPDNLGLHVDDSDDDSEYDDDDDANPVGSTFTITIKSATATKIKNSGWLGKNHSYMMLSYGSAFQRRSATMEGADSASWSFEDDKESYSFTAKYTDLVGQPLKVDLMASQAVLRDSMVGHAELSLRDLILAADQAIVPLSMDFKDKRGLFAGALELRVFVSRHPHHGAMSAASKPFTGIKNTLKPSLTRQESAQQKTTQSHVSEVIAKTRGSKWAVATCSEPNKYTEFTINALNRIEDESGDRDFVAYDENVLLESTAASLMVHLVDVPKALDQTTSWWEYTLDRSLVPVTHHAGMIVDSDVFHVQRVAPEELVDTVSALRLLPLARAATATLQLTPSQDMLFQPLFRHFQAALYTFLLWTTGQENFDGSLLPADLPTPQLLLDVADAREEQDENDDPATDDEKDSGSDEDDDEPEPAEQESDYGDSDAHQDGKNGVLELESGRKSRHSSLAPWIGRPVGRNDVAEFAPTDLEQGAIDCMAQFYERNIPLNAKMIRRQAIMFDLMLMEQLAQFLNVVFILQRALQLTHDDDLRSSYGALPTFLDQTCKAILKFLHACVYKNEKNALKMISVQGMFLSLVSQRISGWDAPIESIMEVCRQYYSSGNESHPGQLSIEAVLTRSIHSSDIRQILEQMSWMHMNNQDSAENIVKLLTLLCRSGKAADHFQNILANLLITCDPTSLELASTGEFPERSCNSMLFSTSYQQGRWHVKFKSQYTLPSQETRQFNQLDQELRREAEHLKKLFNVYNSDESGDDVLDLEECFCLLEDLGFGGPFVYEEMGHLLGVNIWGFLNWWCSRAPFYFLSTSVSHSQISPAQVMQLMGMPLRPTDLTDELERHPIRRQNIMETLQFWSIISSRISGYTLQTLEDESAVRPQRVMPRVLNFHGGATSTAVPQSKSKKSAIRQPRGQDWISFDFALTTAWPDYNWLVSSLVLLESICRGGNILCQRIVSNLLPAECLLELLNTGSISYHDRHIICDLLVSIYVQADFVFPTRALPPSPNVVYCGNAESVHNPAISIGKLFNPVCRMRFTGPGSATGGELRTKLFEFLRVRLCDVTLSFTPLKGTMAYKNSLLRLFDALLSKGFFNEEGFKFFDALPTRELTLSLQKKRIPLEEVFTIDNVEEFLVFRLNEALVAMRGDSSDEPLTSAGAFASLINKQLQARKTFQGFEAVVRKFNSEYEDGEYSALINNTISILYAIHGMKQMKRVQTVWNHCMDHTLRYSLEAYSSDVDDMTTLVNANALTKPLQSLFSEDLRDDDITRALFTATLHFDPQLRQRCYNLLNRRLSLPLETAGLLKSVKLERQSHHAFLKRMLAVYISLALKHAHDAMSPLRNYRAYTIHALQFVLENIVGLLMNRFLDKLASEIDQEAAGRFKEDRNKVIGYYLTSSDVPCPGGQDDFFLLDVKKVKADEAEKEYLMDRYTPTSEVVSFRSDKWVLDATPEMLSFVRDVTPILLTRHSELGHDWLKMDPVDQFAFNRIFSFLTTIGRACAPIRDAVFPLAEPLLCHFYPYSTGAVSLLHLLLSHVHDSRLELNLVTMLKDRLDGLSPDRMLACKVALFTAVLCSPNDAIYLAGLTAVHEELSEYLGTRFAVMEDTDDHEEALAVAHLLAKAVARKHLLSRSVLTSLQLVCPAEALVSMIASDALPLELKTELISIASVLYDADDLAVESLMLAEVRSMRLSMYLLAEAGRLADSTQILHYLTSAVVPALTHRILDSNVINAFIVNEYIMGEAQSMQAKLVNKRAAQYTVDCLARRFPTLHHLPALKPTTSFLPAECVSCFTVMMNILTFEEAYLYRQLDDDQAGDLIWVCAALHFVLLSRSDFVFDQARDASIDVSEYAQVIKGLEEVLHGLVLDRMSLTTEDFFVSRLQRKCLSIVDEAISARYDIDAQPAATGASEKIMFKQKMSIGVTFTAKHLKKTAAFRFLRLCLHKSGGFLRLGGLKILEEPDAPQLRSKAFSSKFSGYSNFDVWLMDHGRVIANLLQHLGDVAHPTQTEFNLLHMLSLLMDTKIDDIRASSLLSQNLKTLLIERETAALHRTQETLMHLGSIRTVVRVLGRQYQNTNPEYVWKYTPLMLKLGGENLSWENKDAQERFVHTVFRSVEQQKPPECNSMLGLQDLIRRCSLGIMASVAGDADREEEQQLDILRASMQIFMFTGALCKGGNLRAQRFLSADGTTSRALVNISEAVCLLLHSILVRLTEMVTYISNEQFYDKLGPMVYAQKDSSKRRLLEWHNPRNNVYLFAQFAHTVSVAFEECVSICSQDSVNEILQAVPKTPELLEFLGALQLKADVVLSGSSLLTFQRSISWKGGDPQQFCKLYLKEMTALGLLKPSDPECAEIKSVLHMWAQKVKSRGASRQFAQIFGISRPLFLEFVRKAEYACLRLLLACLEFASDQQAMSLLSRFNDAILIQNMDGMFLKLQRARSDQRDQLTSTTVSYVSLIESVGIYFKSTDELLGLWDRDMQQRGVRPKSIYGSVELVGADRRLRRVYFPVPTFVTTYWAYPEVQKLKDEIVLGVNRNSPEEKIADFLGQINRVSIVMKRQERLKLLLTYPVHAIFGGKSVDIVQRYFPRQRALGLYLVLALNGWFVRANTHPYSPLPTRPSYLEYRDWELVDIVVYSVQIAHMLLMASFSLRTVLNSDAADSMPSLFKSESSLVQLAGTLIQLPVVLGVLIWDSAWPCVLTGMSFFALTGYYWLYVPCLLDIVFQFEDMNFLYVAISRNVVRVGFTCLLAFLILYFYAIIAYLFFGTQYNLNGFQGCDDPAACFKLHLDYGLSNSPNWDGGGYINPHLDFSFPYSQQVAGAIGTVYNLTYVILINLVLQAVISGLIIDTFSSMRAEKEAVQEDIHGRCFTCSIDRDSFEQAGVSYLTHIKEEHNMWHYAWFKMYLDLKDPLSYSSIENYAIRCMSDKQTFVRMIPINKSLTLEKTQGIAAQEDEAAEVATLTMIMRKLQVSDSRMARLLSSLARGQRTIVESLEAGVRVGDQK